MQAWAREQRTLHGNPGFQSYLNFFNVFNIIDKFDNSSVQYWGTLPGTDGSQESLWSNPPTCSPLLGSCGHSNLIRQWAELAYWFPSLSFAAGNRDLTGLGITSQNLGGNNGAPSVLDFANFASDSQAFEDSHDYTYTVPFSHVYPAFQILVGDLQQ